MREIEGDMLDDLTKSGHKIGRQAGIWTTDYLNLESSMLLKWYCDSKENRPRDVVWRLFGGRIGAQQLVDQMKEYRQNLSAIGFPIPEGELFTVVQVQKTGLYYPTQMCLEQGKMDAESELQHLQGDTEKERLITELLENSLSIVLHEGIGADIKPANWVRVQRENNRQKGRLVHIDPLPIYQYDEKRKMAIMEWPPIKDASIQEFLYQTHLTHRSIGYRFFQELCQVSPGERSLYQRAIFRKLQEWVQEGVLPQQKKEEIIEAMSPKASLILSLILDKEISQEEGWVFVQDELQRLNEAHFLPIYALREMSFVLAERMINEAPGDETEAAAKGVIKKVRELTSLRTPKKLRVVNDRKAVGLLQFQVASLLKK